MKGCTKFKSRGEQNPYGKLFEEIWTFILSILAEFTNLDDIVEFSIRIVKSSLRILGRSFDKYLITFLQNVVQAYKVSPKNINNL